MSEMINLIKGIDNRLLIDELKLATECAYPIAENKTYINGRSVFFSIRENKSMFPTFNSVSDKQVKRIMTYVFRKSGWKVYANEHPKHGRCPIFIRPEGGTL
jgi:hypothetical protein